MPKIDQSKITSRTGSIYPAPFDAMMDGRSSLRLGDAGGLTQFGANLVTLTPGAKSSLRHWHQNQDEFVIMTDGELTLVEDGGETTMNVGDCAAFPADNANGHHLINNTNSDGTFLVIGTRTPTETAYYSDHDLMVKVDGSTPVFTHKDGKPLPGNAE